jgi:integrase/recombinase XerC
MLNDLKINEFILFLKDQKKYSFNTQKAYMFDLNKLLIFLQKQKINNWNKVQTDTLNLFVMNMRSKNISPNSINRIISVARQFFKFLAQDKIHLKNLKTVKSLPKILSYQQFELIVKPNSNHWRELRDIAIIEVLYSCALRVSELIRLNVTDVSEKFLTVSGKGNKTRYTPIGLRAYQAIKKYLSKVANNDAVFVNSNNNRLSERSVQNIVKQRSINAGIKFNVYPHMLRHAAATHFLQSSCDLRSTQEFLGHKSIKSTQVYTHLDFLQLSKIYDKCHPRAKKNK